MLAGAQPKWPIHLKTSYPRSASPNSTTTFHKPVISPIPLTVLAPMPLDITQNSTLAHLNIPLSPYLTTSQLEAVEKKAFRLKVTPKHSSKRTSQEPPRETQPRVQRTQCVIVHGLHEIRADRIAWKTVCCRQRRGSTRRKNCHPQDPTVRPPNFPRSLRVVVSDQAARDLLIWSRLRLLNLYLHV